MPTAVCSERGWKRTPMRPIFFAPTDIQGGGLDEELKSRLRASRHLIVICSPNSAQSKWVGKEIEYFHSLGRAKNIHFFIVDGVPHSGNEATECFNPIVDELGMPEILGVNIHERNYRWAYLNRERAFVQLVTKLLGIEFDAIWQRHKRRMVQRAVAWTVGTVGVVAAVVGAWMANRPVDIELKLNETTAVNDQLPPLKDAIVSIELDNELKTDTIESLDATAIFANVPRSSVGQEARVTVVCKDYVAIDTTMTLQQAMTLGIGRDLKVYGDVQFRLWNTTTETYMTGCEVEVAGQTTTTDDEGRARLTIPLDQQRTSYTVNAAVTLEDNTLYMPNDEATTMLAQ